jgi:hypothetical protein
MTLPLIFIGFSGIFALGLSNLGFIFLFVAQTLILPLGIGIVNFVIWLLLAVELPGIRFLKYYLTVPSSDICNIVPYTTVEGSDTIVTPSLWIAQIFLFMTYLFSNANTIYNMKSTADDTDPGVVNRKTRSYSAMLIIVIVSLVIMGLRVGLVGNCETMLGTILGIFLGTVLGVLWYRLAVTCGAQSADIFGVISGMLPSGAAAKPPTYCANTKQQA